MSTRILSTGHYLPPKIVPNATFEQYLETDDDWIVKRTGIRNRHFCETTAVEMATKAAQKACQNIPLTSIDCVIVGTYTAPNRIPALACQVKENMGLNQSIPAFDVNAACSSFLYALQVANGFILGKLYRRVLIVGCDIPSQSLDFSDRSTCILFGDGAGAAVVEKGESGIVDCLLKTETDKEQVLTLSTTGTLEMKGKTVFKFAVRAVVSAVETLLERNDLSMANIDYIVAHQANQRILDSAAKALGAEGKFLSNIENVGNTGSASLPILMDQAAIESGKRVVLVAFGGGLSYGACLVDKW